MLCLAVTERSNNFVIAIPIQVLTLSSLFQCFELYWSQSLRTDSRFCHIMVVITHGFVEHAAG